MPVKSGNVPGTLGVASKIPGHVGMGTPKAASSEERNSVLCCRPFVVTDPTWLSMFWRGW